MQYSVAVYKIYGKLGVEWMQHNGPCQANCFLPSLRTVLITALMQMPELINECSGLLCVCLGKYSALVARKTLAKINPCDVESTGREFAMSTYGDIELKWSYKEECVCLYKPGPWMQVEIRPNTGDIVWAGQTMFWFDLLTFCPCSRKAIC